jgi:hypothetical protein
MATKPQTVPPAEALSLHSLITPTQQGIASRVLPEPSSECQPTCRTRSAPRNPHACSCSCCANLPDRHHEQHTAVRFHRIMTPSLCSTVQMEIARR